MRPQLPHCLVDSPVTQSISGGTFSQQTASVFVGPGLAVYPWSPSQKKRDNGSSACLPNASTHRPQIEPQLTRGKEKRTTAEDASSCEHS